MMFTERCRLSQRNKSSKFKMKELRSKESDERTLQTSSTPLLWHILLIQVSFFPEHLHPAPAPPPWRRTSPSPSPRRTWSHRCGPIPRDTTSRRGETGRGIRRHTKDTADGAHPGLGCFRNGRRGGKEHHMGWIDGFTSCCGPVVCSIALVGTVVVGNPSSCCMAWTFFWKIFASNLTLAETQTTT